MKLLEAPILPITSPKSFQINHNAFSDEQISNRAIIALNFPSSMLAIVACESGFRQFNLDGSVVHHKNKNGTTDYGIMQINSSHLADSKNKGLDIINDMDDNIAYGKILYAQNGDSPWVCRSLV